MAQLTFAEAVRKVRHAHGLSRRTLSVGFGLSDDARLIYGWENGRNSKTPPVALIRAMWEAEPTFARIAQEIWRLTT